MHELGHVFFGQGHPTEIHDIGYVGVMEYGPLRVFQPQDREIFLQRYGGQ